jgi:hypothetical protein
MIQLMKDEHASPKTMIHFSPMTFPIFMTPGQSLLQLISG